MEKEYYDAQIKYINEVRSIRHDMQAHMIVLKLYLETEQYDKALDYLEKMQKQQSFEQAESFDTGNDLVNAIVRDMIARNKKRIAFSCDGMLPENMPMDDYDICTLFSNMISNACEACEKLQEKAPVIEMKVQYEKESCRIVLQNPIEWKIKIVKGKIATTKKDKDAHGFGLKNIIKVVKKYKGEIDFLVTEECFCTDIKLKVKI